MCLGLGHITLGPIALDQWRCPWLRSARGVWLACSVSVLDQGPGHPLVYQSTWWRIAWQQSKASELLQLKCHLVLAKGSCYDCATVLLPAVGSSQCSSFHTSKVAHHHSVSSLPGAVGRPWRSSECKKARSAVHLGRSGDWTQWSCPVDLLSSALFHEGALQHCSTATISAASN